jgi:hypothetical protein
MKENRWNMIWQALANFNLHGKSKQIFRILHRHHHWNIERVSYGPRFYPTDI